MTTSSGFFTFNFQNWNLAASLEIMKNELESGKNVDWFDFAGEFKDRLEFPLADRAHSFFVRKQIERKRLCKKMSLNSTGELKYFRNLEKSRFETDCELIKLAEEVAYLELIARIRDSSPSSTVYAKILSEYKETFLQTYAATKKILNQGNIDKVFLYNGRFLQERAVWAACSNLQIEVFFYERCSPDWHDRYLIFDEPIHNPIHRSQLMSDFGEIHLATREDYSAAANGWFLKRIKGQTQKFTRFQTISLNRHDKNPFFVFFHSSEDELITTDLISKSWGKQIDALNRLVESMAQLDGIDLIIRAHPNLSHKSDEEVRLWNKIGADLEFKFNWISYLGPESKVNSYDLILQSEGVVTFGSTIGVEAAYLEKKSILIGRAFHEGMEITFNPKNDKELIEFLLADLDIETLKTRKCNAMKYGLFHEFGGIEMRHVAYVENIKDANYRFMDFKISYPLLSSILLRFDSFTKSFNKNLRRSKN